jgi:hypothetical protein
MDAIAEPGCKVERTVAKQSSTARKVFIAPLLLTLTFLLIRTLSGPFYLGTNYDPDYAYLFNSLNLAIFRAPQHTDHPGTPVQLVGALILRAQHPGATQVELAFDTIRNSEIRLSQLNLALFVLLLVCVLGGTAAVSRSGADESSLFGFQSALIFLGVNLYCLARANPEPLLVAVSVALAGMLFSAVRVGEGTSWRAVILIAFLSATGLACKLNFLPLCFLPLVLLTGWKKKGMYFGLFASFLTLWLLPLHAHWPRLVRWISQLLFRTGQYGSGHAGIIDLAELLKNGGHILAQNFPFALLILGSLLLALFNLRRTWSDPTSRRTAVALLAVAICEAIQMLIVCKFGESRYLVPAIGLAGLNFLLAKELLPKIEQPSRNWFRFAWAALLLSALIMICLGAVWLRKQTRENEAVATYVDENHVQATRIFGYGASSVHNARHFGNSFAGRLYSDMLEYETKKEKVVFYSNFRGTYSTYTTLVSLTNLAAGPAIFQGGSFKTGSRIYEWPAGIKLREQAGGAVETAYQVQF